MSGKKMSLAGRLYTGQVSYDFMKSRTRWFTISAVILIGSALVLLLRGLSLGIEFRGGTDFQMPMQIKEHTVEQVRQQVADIPVQDLKAQVFSIGDNAVRVQTRSLNPEETSTVRKELGRIASVPAGEVTYNAIGASWGEQISRQGAIALVVFIVLVMALIAAYFRDWKMSVAAIVALFHDLVVTIGVYALVGFTVTPSTVIGVLTILGYSLYDTVVVFDKIRENVADLEHGSHTYSYQANLAVNQVLVRSLNTTLIGVLPVLALLVAGTTLQSGPLADLGLALFVGMIAGAYSSLFIAAPLLAWLREREPGMSAHRERLERRKERAEHKAAHREKASVTTGGQPHTRQPRRGPGSRAQRKGKK